MGKLGPLVADQPVRKNANVMLKSSKQVHKKQTTAAAPQYIAVIKNSMTDQEMDESGEAWANHQGAYMTLAEVLAIEKAKQEQPAAN